MGQSSAGAGTQITAASLRTPRAAAASYLALRFDLSGLRQPPTQISH